MFGETLSWWTPTHTTTNWPLIIHGLPPLFLQMSICRLLYHSISILICPNMLVMSIISRFRLRAHTFLKVEAAAWLEDGSCVCDQCPGEDEHVQNELHALLLCQDHRVCELRKHFSFLFTPFFEDCSAAQPFLLQQVNNQLVHDFLSQQSTSIDRLFLSLSELMDLLWLEETSQQPISQTTRLKVTPIVTIGTPTVQLVSRDNAAKQFIG